MGDSSHTDGLSGFSTEHRAHRRVAGTPTEKPRLSLRGYMRDLVLICGLVAIVVLIMPFGDVANPEFAEADAHATSLQAAFQSVWRGDASPEAAAIAGDLRAYEYPLGERTVLVMVHPEPTAAGTCYGLRTGGGLGTVAVRYTATYDCVSAPRTVFEAEGTWSDVLPSRRVTSLWFVPALVVLVGCVVVLATKLVLKLLLK